jgi:catechol 2,3-dioxygenase-like lactoylglutathione lyase family enzyme
MDSSMEGAMDYKLEVVVVPVSDVDRAKRFYSEQCGFNVDLDDTNGGMRIVQLTPPGSACSVTIGSGITTSPPGSYQGLQLVVVDIEAARAELTGRGVDVGSIRHFENGEWIDGKGGPWNSFASFADPDGNGWLLQETPNQ